MSNPSNQESPLNSPRSSKFSQTFSSIYQQFSNVSRNNLFKQIKYQIILFYSVHFLLDGILFKDLSSSMLVGSAFTSFLFICLQNSITDILHHLNVAFFIVFGVLLFSSGNYSHKTGMYLPQLSLLITNNAHFAVFLQMLMFIMAAITNFEKFTGTELYSSTILIAALMIIIHLLRQGNIKEENLKAKVDSSNALMKETQQKLQDAINFNKSLHLTVSHEFRNPLNSIVGNLDLIQKKLTVDDTSQEHIKMAKIGCDTLLNALNNTLDSCKAEFDEIDINYVSVNIRKTFEKIWGVCSEFLRLKGLQGELYFHVSVPPMLLVDTERLHQIILNLVHNSSKFTSKGFVKIIVSWHPCYDLNNQSTITFGSNNRLPSQNSILTNSNNNKRPSTPEKKKAKTGSNDFSGMFEEDFSEHPCNTQKITFSPSMNYNKLDLNTKKFPKMHKRIIPISNDEGIGFLKIQVIDSGVGIHSSNLPKLFQKFSKFTHDSKPRVEGNGLGLWITKKICNKMDGSIRVYSDLNKGSTFLVFLKCQISPQSLGTPTPSPYMGSRRDRSTLQTMGSLPFMMNKSKMESNISLKEQPKKDEDVKLTAMVVDDIPYNQQLNKQFLELCGVSVKFIAANGSEAYKKCTALDRDQFDLIFMDLDMPVMDGKTSSMKIREWEKKHQAKPVIIVILTGNCSEDELKLCLDKVGPIKADYFYRKPLSLADCQNLIRQIKREKVKKQSLSNNFPRMADFVLLFEKDLFQQVLLENYLRVGQVKYYISNKSTILEKFAKYYDTISAILYSCEEVNENLQDYKEFVCQIRGFLRKKGRKDIPILGITKEGNRDEMAKLREVGFSDFLIKPFDYESTIKLIKSHSLNGLPIQ